MINNLRISVTDQCNLHCFYCAPSGQQKAIGPKKRLTLEEMARIIKIFVGLGITRIKITGGEPLLVKDLVKMIARIRKIPGVEDISLTTNGVLLGQKAQSLKKAGLNRINISMDTLQPKRYLQIAGKDSMSAVKEGLKSALEADFDIVKVNFIPLKGINDDEILDFVALALRYSLIVRFIELFSTNCHSRKNGSLMIRTSDIKQQISKGYGDLQSVFSVKGDGPAEYFSIAGTRSKIGFISNYSENFCQDCTRLRMDSAGAVRPCLFSRPLCYLKPLILEGRSDADIFYALQKVIDRKSLFTKRTNCVSNVEMSTVGG